MRASSKNPPARTRLGTAFSTFWVELLDALHSLGGGRLQAEIARNRLPIIRDRKAFFNEVFVAGLLNQDHVNPDGEGRQRIAAIVGGHRGPGIFGVCPPNRYLGAGNARAV